MLKKTISLILVMFFLFNLGFLVFAQEKIEPKYTFYDVFWDAQDPNLAWFTKGAEDFMKRYPEVRVEVVAAEKWDANIYLETLETILAKKPDGLVICVVDPVAIDESMRSAIAKGIPVIQATLADYRTDAPKYLTYMGGDEYLAGKVLGERLLKEIKPKHVVTCMTHLGHAGAEMRAKGMEDAVKETGSKFDKLALGTEPSGAKEVLTAYLMANQDVDAIFTTTTVGTPWIYSVMKDLERTDIKLITVDASPCALEGIIAGKVLATFSQGFYAQATMPYEWLFYYLEYGIKPPPTILTGPIVVDETNVMKFKKTVTSVFGEKFYNEITMW